MARIAEARLAAEPVTATQQERRRRILAAATACGAENDLERVMMQEVARRADVAIATLYRYFPSKTHLFVGVMADQVQRLATLRTLPLTGDTSPTDAVADVLIRATNAFVRHPKLASSMVMSMNVADPTVVTDVATIDEQVMDVLFAAAGIEEPDAEQRTLFRLLLQTWYGVLQTRLNSRLSPAQAEEDLRTATRLLLGPLDGRR